MIEVKTDRRSELSFKLNIEGTTNAKPVARLVLPLNNFSLFIKGAVLDEKVTVAIPPLNKLKEYIPSGKVVCYLEVIIGENYFIPWEDGIHFKHPVMVTAESEETQEANLEEETTKISITMEDLKEEEETPEPHIEEEMEEPEPEPNENLVQLMQEKEPQKEGEVIEKDVDTSGENEQIPQETEEGVEEKELEEKEEEQERTEEKEEKQKPKKKKYYTYNEFLESSISARDYLDGLFNKEDE